MRTLFSLLLIMLLSSCQSTQPSFTQLTRTLTVKELQSENFKHIVIFNRAFRPNTPVNIYIEGDGIPWVTQKEVADKPKPGHLWQYSHTISSDPTPNYPLALHLMTKDESSAIYISRPCYFIRNDLGCAPFLWTNARYSKTVINSIENIINQNLVTHSIPSATLVGYSGGGTITTLLAQQVNSVTKLITINANLDHQKWVDYHGYSSLNMSLTPSFIPDTIQQYHLVGLRDLNVPYTLNKSIYVKLNTQPLTYKGYTHTCCWVKDWPKIMRYIHTDSSSNQDE